MFWKMNVTLPALSLLLLTAAAHVQAQDASPYIVTRPGTLPIILTAPHGGHLRPNQAKTRTFGLLSQDTNTAELTLMIAAELQALYGGNPHLVICLMHRIKVDCNRDLEEAAQGDPLAIATWHRFHNSVEAMRKDVTRKFGAGLVLDIHGHRHEQPRVELGYLLTGAQLSVPDEALNQDPRIAAETSIRELDRRSPASLASLLRGRQSLGGLLEERGFRCVPSPANPTPGTKAAYFSGAYDVMAHGSRDEGTVSAIQIECPWDGLRDKPQNQLRFAKAFAAALGKYFEVHFGKKL
jgi:hypothetical protein